MHITLNYSKTCVNRPLSKRQKIVFQDQLSLNAGQKYCRMLQLFCQVAEICSCALDFAQWVRAQASGEKWLLPPVKLGRNDSQIGRGYSIKSDIFCQFRSKLAIAHTVAINGRSGSRLWPQLVFVWWQNEKEAPLGPIKKGFLGRLPVPHWGPFRAKVWPLGWPFHPSRPLAYSLWVLT